MSNPATFGTSQGVQSSHLWDQSRCPIQPPLGPVKVSNPATFGTSQGVQSSHLWDQSRCPIQPPLGPVKVSNPATFGTSQGVQSSHLWDQSRCLDYSELPLIQSRCPDNWGGLISGVILTCEAYLELFRVEGWPLFRGPLFRVEGWPLSGVLTRERGSLA